MAPVMTGSIVLAARWPACAGPPDHRAGSGRGSGAYPSRACPDPVCPSACVAAPSAPFSDGRGLALVAGHDVNLVDLHLALQPRLRDPGHQTAAQLFGHGLSIGRAQLQLQGDLPVREVQAHKVEAQHPHPQRLMVSGQHCPGEVVKARGAGLAAIALPMRLGVVASVADYRIAAAAGTAHALRPAVLAYQREALGVVQQGREIDQIDGWHDGGGSSHEPVSYSPSRLQARPPSAPRLSPDPTTLKDDKSHSSLN